MLLAREREKDRQKEREIKRKEEAKRGRGGVILWPHLMAITILEDRRDVQKFQNCRFMDSHILLLQGKSRVLVNEKHKPSEEIKSNWCLAFLVAILLYIIYKIFSCNPVKILLRRCAQSDRRNSLKTKGCLTNNKVTKK